ncbi:MAG: bifunctional glycosyltransferase/class I SAM-dependent methyltransferase [Treponema sp.]|nr:bifunctional glycosyltransferase/class I SAM-dependent methyltransferase [Treponema sp.]
MKTNRAVIIQCRLSSTRLPEKALKPLGNKTVLDWVLTSMKKVPADEYYVATDEASFKYLEPICKNNGFNCFAGDLNNVLKRYCDLIKTLDVDVIIRATADNPFLFYEAAIASVEEFERKNKDGLFCDYLTYSGLPHGSGVEVFSAKSLLKAASQTDSPYDQEHVGPALYNHKDKFNCEFIKAPSEYYYPTLRTTIDTPADYLRAISIVNFVNDFKDVSNKEPFTTKQIVKACLSKYIENPVIYMPSLQKGHGTGHFHRCLSACLETKSFIYIPESATLQEKDSLISLYKEKGLKEYQIIKEITEPKYPRVLVTDLFKITKEDQKIIDKFDSVIAIDEGSVNTQNLDYLLDIIPSCDEKSCVNLRDPAYISKPKNRKVQKETDSIEKILICIGGEDPSNLTKPSVEIMTKLFPQAKITAVGKDFDQPIKDLKEKLYEYDLVITHYGLTAFEAVSAGCKVILLATTKLHEQLAQKYNYSYIPFGQLNLENFEKALASENLLPSKSEGEEKELKDLINMLASGKRMACPVCQNEKANNEVVSRNATRTYRRCKNCGLVYISWSCEKDKTYEKAYFFEDYKKQYGKTYQEDFESIKAQCVKRVNVINKVANKTNSKNILDIGCAYGPFLKAASEKGYTPFGTDISEDAIEYVKKELQFPASVAGFPEINTEQAFGHAQFDVVTMWYVIEHFKNLDAVLSKVNKIVKNGGVFAFSTPSGEGVSAISDKDHFYQISPTDHYSVWEPGKANKALKKYGFKIVKVVSTGHHPERFPSIKKSGAQKGSLQWKAVDKYSKARKLGDTVEIYCRKISEYDK